MIKRFLFPAACAFALQFTLSCSTEDKEEGNVAKYTCQLSDGCIPTVSISDCEQAGGKVVDVCEDQLSSSGGWPNRSSSSVARSSSSSPVTSNCTLNGKTVAIGSQVWMAENLNCNVSGSKCYNDDPANCTKYGRLYDWATAMNLPDCGYGTSCTSQISAKHRGICPSGWHIPSDDEWSTLTTYVGGASTAGTKLKSKTGWESYSGVPAGTDDYGFAALPGGYGNSGGDFYYVGYYGYWWSATESNAYSAFGRSMDFDDESVSWYDYTKVYLFSVRCLQD